TDWLEDHLTDPAVRVVDVRWYLLDPQKGGEEYRRGHVPGAVFMNVDGDLAARVGEGPGRHPLPRPEAFAEAAARAGIGPNTHVVAYDDAGGANAGRLWWLLRYFGHEKASLLDGGINRWIQEGRPLETAIRPVERGAFVPRLHPEWAVDREQVNALRTDKRALILDSRAPERYRGEVEPIDPRAGHIPGARSAPLAGNLRGADDLRFKTAEELRARFEELGAGEATRIVAYCGSGVNACQNILALNLAGFSKALLYPGSWSDWSSSPDRPAAQGAEP
ncbi:MAG: sulfurtransferase, partial [Rudaea sp.]